MKTYEIFCKEEFKLKRHDCNRCNFLWIIRKV